ncbi:hypothetical protein FRC02_011254 [Tulasnella sp. 418]|nr:hypothetical protein FRC02_011254 [Tulasnella sp. 418]
MQSIFDDIPIHAIKTGMLVDKEIVDVVVNTLTSRYPSAPRPPIVVDPVTVSTSGHVLFDSASIDVIKSRLIPLATMVTPNILEAELILSTGQSTPLKITNLEDMIYAARSIAQLGCTNVLLKGGHLPLRPTDVDTSVKAGICVAEWCNSRGPNDALILGHVSRQLTSASEASVVVDVLYSSQASIVESTLMAKPVLFVKTHIDSTSTHGTGCTLSAALASQLAKNPDVLQATRLAIAYTHEGIATAPNFGKGHGPLNHMHSIIPRTISAPNPAHPAPFTSGLIQSFPDLWRKYVQHDFVVQLGKGTLPKANFIHFIKQDYHYLRHYARAYGLLASKSTSYEDIGSAARTIHHIIQESTMHASFCALWGISEAELINTTESPALSGYASYMIDTGLRGDATALLVALASCLLGYGEVGLWLKKRATEGKDGFYLEGNIYKRWIDDYAGEEYQRAVRHGIESLEQHVARCPPSLDRYRELQEIWKNVLKFEIGFWDMAMGLL